MTQKVNVDVKTRKLIPNYSRSTDNVQKIPISINKRNIGIGFPKNEYSSQNALKKIIPKA
jgi:hypothetical protein